MTAGPGRRPWRWGWLALGGAACGLGFAGMVIPGLPATVFFVAAAGCFARSSPRLLAWVLNLPKVGPLVRDYRAGLGMPRRAKMAALVLMLGFGLSSLWILQSPWAQGAVAALLAIGVVVVVWKVPTREAVLRRQRT